MREENLDLTKTLNDLLGAALGQSLCVQYSVSVDSPIPLQALETEHPLVLCLIP